MGLIAASVIHKQFSFQLCGDEFASAGLWKRLLNLPHDEPFFTRLTYQLVKNNDWRE